MSSNKIRLLIARDSDVTQAILRTKRFCEQLGFHVHVVTMIVTTVSELAHNIRKYAQMGEIQLRKVSSGFKTGIEVVAVDKGPGIPDINKAMQDHVSSGGTLGLGLPGVQRMMDEFEIKTEPRKGTEVTVRKWM